MSPVRQRSGVASVSEEDEENRREPADEEGASSSTRRRREERRRFSTSWETLRASSRAPEGAEGG